MTYLTFAENSNISRLALAGERPVIAKRRKKMVVLTLIICGLVLSLAVLNLVLVNSIVRLGYEMRKNTEFKKAIEEANKGLEVQVSKMKSLQSLEAVIRDRGFVNVERISYIKSGQPSLANR